MGSYGERFSKVRNARGVSLESISQTTKIRKQHLEAIENDQFDKLPGGAFKKGFVRSYAAFLGLNEEEAVKDFIAVAGDPEQPLPDPPAKPRAEIPEPKERRPAAAIAVAICAVALLVAGWRMGPLKQWTAQFTPQIAHAPKVKRSAPSAASTGSIATSAALAPTRKPPSLEPPLAAEASDPPENAPRVKLERASHTTTAAAEPEPTNTTATAQGDRFFVAVKANKPTWVSITVDGKPWLEGVLKRKKKIVAESEVVLNTNNAGAISVWLNGKHLLPLGPEGEQTAVTFSRGGVTHSSSEVGATRNADSPPAPLGSDTQAATGEIPDSAKSQGSETPPEN